MTEKRFTITQDFEEHHRQIRDNGHIIMGCFLEAQAEPIVKLLNDLSDENEQLTQQLQIFEKFLEGNDLSIDWEEFCGLEECAFENPNFSCKSCIYLKGDV